MTTLAFMQNQWFREPERVRQLFMRLPDKRNELIRRLLFSGCLSGRHLQSWLGMELCERIIWEEASLEIGGFSASRYDADLNHMKSTILKFEPTIILCFGKVASDGVKRLLDGDVCNVHTILFLPHPASRDSPGKKIMFARTTIEGITRLRCIPKKAG